MSEMNSSTAVERFLELDAWPPEAPDDCGLTSEECCARAAAIDRWCCERLASQRGLSGAVRRARDAILSAHGRVELGSLAESLGLGARQFERRFRREIGIPARTLARLTRSAHARALLDHAPALGLAELAQAAGYYDQAHFTHEFTRTLDGHDPRSKRLEEFTQKTLAELE